MTIVVLRPSGYNRVEAKKEALPIDQGELITLREAAEISGLSHSHLRNLARSGKLKAKKLGTDWTTTREAVAGYLKDFEARKRGPRKTRH